jgi:hypothetical protein
MHPRAHCKSSRPGGRSRPSGSGGYPAPTASASAAWFAGHATEVGAVRVAGGDAAVGEDAIAALAEAVGAG